MDSSIRLGLKENWQQFTLLVLVNMMVGGMVGLERTLVPLVGTEEFNIQSDIVVFSFIIAFGLVKAFTNLISGVLADKYTRKKVLIWGWLVGLPVPFLLAFAPSWNWILFANVLLGISQGLAWSMTVNMKIDLVGKKSRGLAMGLNEAAGYGAVGLTALLTGYLASYYGLRPEPFYIGIAYTIVGILMSVLFIKDTRKHAELEASQIQAANSGEEVHKPNLWWVFKQTLFKNKNLFSISQAGLINNLNDGMSWGVFPLLFMSMGVGLEGVGWIKAVYPVVWGVGQIVTGPLADKWGRKPLIVWGMFIQVLGHIVIGLEFFDPLTAGLIGSVLLGLGTAMVYPALLAAVSDAAHPSWRASSLGVYRFWRDMGYAVGALMAGIVGNFFGLMWAVHIAGIITFVSGIIVWVRMKETMEK
ncbi:MULTISPECIES: MFS transporter [Mucilaginibacter]|uniref:MFS transporter n=2 Tax=Mucilaginibacter rubeus TaxID=2027860 RepID=A0ABX7U8A2_9SPHI|nr:MULTISPECIES: MFS transporter [Mucilaginibacter]QTE42370.1 MFS transporter [Mucilaginibacter rubeus]QTE48971.1 MFS transporter [Mucilaginibacter rubeus]QTE54069.1 MFS transporter [Mucilaginibacter rubeus]QTE66476.1 MFS transporter [Mucilaginibacter rubeus]QTF65223.1 MFS transporter [Mucilaginibacter rubeus]